MPVDPSDHLDLVFQRNFKDKNNNSYGKLLSELCLTHNLMILHSRTVGDFTGKYTCFRYNGNSTVDLILTDKNVQNKFKYFKVLSLTEWSDHCEIKTEVTIKPREKLLGNNKHCMKVNKNFNWDESSDLKVNNYVNSVEFKEMTKSIIEKLKTESISRNGSINKRVEELIEILIKVSTKYLKTRDPTDPILDTALDRIG